MIKKYECIVCGFVYDEEEGLPNDDIPPGTKWEEIQDTWTCFECSAPKSDFQELQ